METAEVEAVVLHDVEEDQRIQQQLAGINGGNSVCSRNSPGRDMENQKRPQQEKTQKHLLEKIEGQASLEAGGKPSRS